MTTLRQRTVTDALGRRVLTYEEVPKGMIPFDTNGQPWDVLGMAAFQVVGRLACDRAKGGHLILSAGFATNASFANDFACIEVNLIGYGLHGQQLIIFRTALDGNLSAVDFLWEAPEYYQAIGIEARQVVDGAASGVVTGIDTLNISALGGYWE